jgi:REP element-mobilizing transposase RayT
MSMTEMKQRCWEHDYSAPSFYMLTIVTEPRRECLSEVVGDVAAGAAATRDKLLKLRPMGELVQEVWRRTSSIYPGVEACECVAMPDHFHGILWVKEPQKRHMGHIVKAFKRVSTQECRKQGLLPAGSVVGAAPAGSVVGTAPAGSVVGAAPAGSVVGAAPAPTLWEEGYQDSILLHRGQLKAMANYIADNPRRHALKRANPQLFTVVHSLTVAPSRTCPAIGNRFLLDLPVKRQIQVSRRISAEALADKKEELLYAAEHGAVLVSPCISPGEKEIARAALDAGLPLMVVLTNGLQPHYKPPGRYFDACAAGNLLMLAPLPYNQKETTLTRDQCLTLNEWAATIAGKE